MAKVVVAIEGSDGAGKETQSDLLVGYFMRREMSVERVSFPRYHQTAGGTFLFEALKGKESERYDFVHVDPLAASLFYAADRWQSLPYLKSLIADNDVVIFDRYVESNLLHQGGKFKTAKEREAFARFLYNLEYGMLALPQPQVILYLKLPFQVSQDRARKRAEGVGGKLDAVESNLEYVKNSHEAGIFYAEHFNWEIVDCVTIDGQELSREEIHSRVVGQLSRRLGRLIER